MDWNYPITSEFSRLEEFDKSGKRVAVGFRPSGELHVGNLLTLGYSAVIADRLDLQLDLMCCDTDWSAHIHGHHRPEENDVMRLFFNRECPCGDHDKVADHRMEGLHPFLAGLEKAVDAGIETGYLTDINDSEGYVDALRNLLENMDDFDSIFGGGFRRRYRSPLASVCGECGFSHSKGSSYSRETGELVAACRNPDCSRGFSRSRIDGEKGVYYLVDPVRDPSRKVAVHVFGGDYRTAEKEQKTPKVSKVARITKLATGETPAYFLSPMISDSKGKPLSKSKGIGRTVSEIDDLESYAGHLVSKIDGWLDEDRRHVSQEELF